MEIRCGAGKAALSLLLEAGGSSDLELLQTSHHPGVLASPVIPSSETCASVPRSCQQPSSKVLLSPWRPWTLQVAHLAHHQRGTTSLYLLKSSSNARSIPSSCRRRSSTVAVSLYSCFSRFDSSAVEHEHAFNGSSVVFCICSYHELVGHIQASEPQLSSACRSSSCCFQWSSFSSSSADFNVS